MDFTKLLYHLVRLSISDTTINHIAPACLTILQSIQYDMDINMWILQSSHQLVRLSIVFLMQKHCVKCSTQSLEPLSTVYHYNQISIVLGLYNPSYRSKFYYVVHFKPNINIFTTECISQVFTSFLGAEEDFSVIACTLVYPSFIIVCVSPLGW